MAAKQGFLMYYSKGDAIGTKVSVRYRRSGRLSGVVVKRGSTVDVYLVRLYVNFSVFCLSPMQVQKWSLLDVDFSITEGELGMKELLLLGISTFTNKNVTILNH